MGFESESFSKLERRIPTGQEDTQKIPNKNVFATLFCQLSQPNLKQHRLPQTSQRSQPWLAAGGHQGCSRERGWGESVFPDPDWKDFLLNSVWRVTCEMKALCVALHFLAKQNSQSESGEHTAPLTKTPDSSPQLCDVNANDISAMANM